MIQDLRVTTIVENTVRQADLLAEHGLAFWVEADRHRILFDTGQGRVLRPNAGLLGIRLDSADAIALSHGHFDHTGGLAGLLDTPRKLDLYLHPAALRPKYARQQRPPHREIGVPDMDEGFLRSRVQRLTWTARPTALFPDIYLTGEVPRQNDFEDTGGPFYLDEACTRPDPLPDDQALYVDTVAGLVVILGCAHAGVVNTLDYITRLTGRRQVHAVLGGMHLGRARGERLEATADALKRYGVKVLAPAHCTGIRAVTYLRTELPDQCVDCSVGSSFTFPGSSTRS